MGQHFTLVAATDIAVTTVINVCVCMVRSSEMAQ